MRYDFQRLKKSCRLQATSNMDDDFLIERDGCGGFTSETDNKHLTFHEFLKRQKKNPNFRRAVVRVERYGRMLEGLIMKTHCLIQVPRVCGGMNKHRMWFCTVNGISIFSNDDISGDRFYMTEGEQANTIWYPTPTAAAIAYNKHGQAAVDKTARRCSKN